MAISQSPLAELYVQVPESTLIFSTDTPDLHASLKYALFKSQDNVLVKNLANILSKIVFNKACTSIMGTVRNIYRVVSIETAGQQNPD